MDRFVLLAEAWSVESVLIVAVTSLATVVGKLWMDSRQSHAACLEENKLLEKKIEELWQELLNQSRLGNLGPVTKPAQE